MYATRNTDLWPTNYRTGMWVWILHRASGLVLAFYGVVHLFVISTAMYSGASFNDVMDFFHEPVLVALELVLLAAVLFHTANGGRILLMDMGLGIRGQKRVFWGLLGVGIVLLGFMTWGLWGEIF